MYTSSHNINLVIADNGVMMDWGDHKEIYPSDPKSLAILLAKITGHFEGYYSGEFTDETIDIKVRTKENWADNEGI